MRDGSQFRRVVVCSGHMIDQPDRPVPRFPRHKEARQIASQERAWGINSEGYLNVTRHFGNVMVT
jgi:hypothetical protein